MTEPDNRTYRIEELCNKWMDAWLMNVIKEWIERKQKKLYNG